MKTLTAFALALSAATAFTACTRGPTAPSASAPSVVPSPAPAFSSAGYGAPLNPFDQFAPTWYECTRYAWGRAYEKLGVRTTFTVSSRRDGGKWYDLITDDFARGSTVAANSFAVWSDGDLGHVAFVESVGEVNATITEANLGLDGRYNGSRDIRLSKTAGRSGS